MRRVGGESSACPFAAITGNYAFIVDWLSGVLETKEAHASGMENSE